MSEAVITLHGVKKSYGRHQVLDGVDLQVNRGDIYGLVGRNGAGKTTIFKVILGLSAFQGGSLDFGLGERDLKTARRHIGFFIGGNFYPYMSARENLRYHCRLKGLRESGEVQRVLEIIGLDQAKGPYKNFSMGMKQRLGIGKALLGNPDVLILDEPTNGLDPQGIADVRALVQRLNRELGMTVIISSHILSELQNTAHRFGIIHQGRLVREVNQEELSAGSNVIKLKVDDLERAAELLREGGVEILEQTQERAKLEDYYFELLKEDAQSRTDGKKRRGARV